MFYQTIAVICFWWLTTCRETLNTLFLLWLPTANRLFVSLFTYFQFLVFVLCFLCWTFHWSSSGYSFLRLFWYTSTLCYCYFKLGHTPSLWFFFVLWLYSISHERLMEYSHHPAVRASGMDTYGCECDSSRRKRRRSFKLIP